MERVVTLKLDYNTYAVFPLTALAVLDQGVKFTHSYSEPWKQCEEKGLEIEVVNAEEFTEENSLKKALAETKQYREWYQTESAEKNKIKNELDTIKQKLVALGISFETAKTEPAKNAIEVI